MENGGAWPSSVKPLTARELILQSSVLPHEKRSVSPTAHCAPFGGIQVIGRLLPGTALVLTPLILPLASSSLIVSCPPESS
eukprot:1561050-Prymnesium_polylepis.1